MTRWEQDDAARAHPAEFPTRRSLHHGRRRRRSRWLWLPRILVALIVVAVVGTFFAYQNLDANIERVNVAAAIGTDRPTPVVEGPLNILILGSDTRQGIGTTEYGADTVEGGAHSDTNLLVHISGDRKRAIVVSIPRDSMVKAPADCTDLTSTVEDGVVRQWNLNYNKGGAPCVIRTFEGNTGIRLDHFIVIDFAGFQNMVDALGGVEVCLSKDVKDKDAHFELAAGRHVLDGKQALGYVRLRKSVGDGSDLGRIERQQAFLSSVAQKATSTSLLLRPDRLYSFLDAATESMTTDDELSTTELAKIAHSVRSIGLRKVEFVTVPTETYPPDPNRVQWTAAADELWQLIKHDRPVRPEEATTAAPSVAPTTPSKPLTVTPDEISVYVSNASGASGLSRQTVSALSVQGFVAMIGSDISTRDLTGTAIRHAADQAEAARTVQAAFPGSVLVEDSEAGDSITVQMGLGAANPVEVPNRLGVEPLPPLPLSAQVADPGATTEKIQVRTAEDDICK